MMNKENDKHLFNELTQMIEAMRLNQEKFIVDHSRKMRSMHIRWITIEEKHVEELSSILEIIRKK